MRGFLSLFGTALGSGLAAGLLIVVIALAFGKPVHAHEAPPQAVLCYNQTQLDVLILARRGGLGEIQAINGVNKGHQPVCARMPVHISRHDPPLSRLVIDHRVYEMHALRWLRPIFFGIEYEYEYRVALILAPMYGI